MDECRCFTNESYKKLVCEEKERVWRKRNKSDEILSNRRLREKKKLYGYDLRTEKKKRVLEKQKKVVERAWYCGYGNSVRQPPASFKGAAKRYGAQGAFNLEIGARQYIYALKLKVRGDKVVDYLRKDGKILGKSLLFDEFKDKLSGSPILFPIESMYVTGSSLKAKYEFAKYSKKLERWVEKNCNHTREQRDNILKERKKVRPTEKGIKQYFKSKVKYNSLGQKLPGYSKNLFISSKQNLDFRSNGSFYIHLNR
eukprot:snap_masked-scaffold_27-processed-gene-2.22-mRNA-1 protein AED:1.00 eAED:1.00 QI:0/0/0/0/1/1/2/0/254